MVYNMLSIILSNICQVKNITRVYYDLYFIKLNSFIDERLFM